MKNRVLALTLTFSILLFGCGMALTLANQSASAAQSSETASGENAPTQNQTEDAQIAEENDSIIKAQQLNNYDAVSLRTSGNEASQTVLVIQNLEALDAYYKTNLSSDNLDKRCGTISFEEAIHPYNEKFFDENVLLMIRLMEKDTSVIPQVSGLSSDGTIYIERSTDPSSTASGQQWYILISVPKDASILESGNLHVIEY